MLTEQTLQALQGRQNFFETVFDSRLEYATRKAKVAKYGQPDFKWTLCPELSSVVAVTLPKEV